MSDRRDNGCLSADELERVASFRRAFNRVEKELRKRLRQNPSVPFVQLIAMFDKKFVHDLDIAFLRNAASLRNLIAHNELYADDHFAVPSSRMVAILESVSNSLWNPIRVIPMFRKNVETVSLRDSLSHVLHLARKCDFSQFPVYHNGQFRGLLTENGITRWVAEQVATRRLPIDPARVSVRDVICEEEERESYQFIAGVEEVQAARKRFADAPNLEALLITESGSSRDPLLGIITTWDVSRT